VHRDLKRTNIFVTPEGTPKLLDFGIAKLLSEGAGRTITTVMARPLTPAYASPEQVRGLAVTTAADIYSLGAVLYELLTARRAYRISAATPGEVERAVCEDEIVPPRTPIRKPSLTVAMSISVGFFPTSAKGSTPTRSAIRYRIASSNSASLDLPISRASFP
jgi:serine/threonine protein kinase